jgi:hypothetical protein
MSTASTPAGSIMDKLPTADEAKAAMRAFGDVCLTAAIYALTQAMNFTFAAIAAFETHVTPLLAAAWTLFCVYAWRGLADAAEWVHLTVEKKWPMSRGAAWANRFRGWVDNKHAAFNAITRKRVLLLLSK